MNLSDKIVKLGCYLVFTIALSFYSEHSCSQSIKDLEVQINDSKRQIEKAEKMLRTKESQAASNVEKLSLIRSQMNNRQNIVNNMRKQRDIVARNITTNNSTISRLQKEHGDLRGEYSDMMVLAYKNFIFNNTLTFLFAAKDFNELQMRIFYIRRYSNLRYQLSVQIDERAKEIGHQRDSLKIKRSELETLVANTQVEINALDADSKRYNKVLNDIKNDKKQLSSQIKKSQDNIKKLQNKISQLIAEEARRQREAQKKAKPAEVKKYTAESSVFSQNKGSLIQPTENGIITERFGTHPHPIYKTHIVENKGLNYQVPDNSSIQCVFNGVVAKIFFVQGLMNTVMVRHGDYLTTYSGLTDVNVQTGDVVSTGETLGRIKGSSSGLFHFELWKGTVNLNPEQWLKK